MMIELGVKYMIQKTEQFVKDIHSGDASGHDWFHIDRVRKIALSLQQSEGGNPFIIEMAALLHDVADEKLFGEEEIGIQKINQFLKELEVTEVDSERIIHIIRNISYKGGNGGKVESVEGKIVQDADRLDAIGAIGIARTFAYGGNKGRMLYHPDIQPRESMTKEAYRNDESPSLNHFYEKLFKLKDLMNTKTAKIEAEARHIYMVQFVEQFMKEWNVE